MMLIFSIIEHCIGLEHTFLDVRLSEGKLKAVEHFYLVSRRVDEHTYGNQNIKQNIRHRFTELVVPACKLYNIRNP